MNTKNEYRLKLYSLQFVIAFVSIASFSCNKGHQQYDKPTSIDIWPDPIRGSVSKQVIDSSGGDNIIRITEVNQPSMDVYLSESDESQTAVLIFPGGGYGILAYDLEGTEIAEWLNSFGIAAFVVKYTVPNDRESAYQDGKRAIKMVRANAKSWNIDEDKVGVLGFSAGGHLAARLSNDFPSSVSQQTNELDDISSIPDFSILVYPAYLAAEGSKRVSSDLNPSKLTPPTLIIQTKDDEKFVDGTYIFAETLDSFGIELEFLLLEEGGHGYGLRADKNLDISRWPDHTISWLKKHGLLD